MLQTIDRIDKKKKVIVNVLNCLWEIKIDMVLKGRGNMSFSTEICRWINSLCPAAQFKFYSFQFVNYDKRTTFLDKLLSLN